MMGIVIVMIAIIIVMMAIVIYNNKMLLLPWIGNQIVGLAVRGAGTVVPVAGAD